MSIEPRIRYAKTGDGVRIAFWTLGEGEPIFVSSPFVFCNAGLEGRIPMLEAVYRRIASRGMVVRWDVRNYGMSQRGVGHLGPEDWAGDALAVADELGADRFDFVGLNFHPTVAAVEPDRVRKLALVMPSAPRLAVLFEDPDQAAVRSLAASNWNVFSETHGSFLQGWSPDARTDLARFIRESVDQADYLRIMDAWRDWDVTPYLPRIECPTLVVGSSLAAAHGPKHMREGWLTYASEIPDCELVEVDGHPMVGDPALDCVVEFLGGDPAVADPELKLDAEAASDRTSGAGGRFQTVLFTDIVDHTEMMTRLGDTRGREVLREHERVTREALQLHGGAEVKTMGDGFLVSFESVSQAVRCAVSLQRAFAEEAADDEPIKIRIGINAGEPVQEDGDLFGSAVILAARIAATADGDEILIPAALRHLLAGKEFTFEDRGEHDLKGFDDPVRLYEVNWRDLSSQDGTTR